MLTYICFGFCLCCLILFSFELYSHDKEKYYIFYFQDGACVVRLISNIKRYLKKISKIYNQKVVKYFCFDDLTDLLGFMNEGINNFTVVDIK